uniref:Uncharacterized protein n=1 Tax=Glossina austeni TaxID=7395 RepID=A0A1A9VTE1_GLOAU
MNIRNDDLLSIGSIPMASTGREIDFIKIRRLPSVFAKISPMSTLLSSVFLLRYPAVPQLRVSSQPPVKIVCAWMTYWKACWQNDAANSFLLIVNVFAEQCGAHFRFTNSNNKETKIPEDIHICNGLCKCKRFRNSSKYSLRCNK